MKWRVMVELTGSDGTVRKCEVSAGGSSTAECSAATVGLTRLLGQLGQRRAGYGVIWRGCHAAGYAK
jgi:hypothetical protein